MKKNVLQLFIFVLLLIISCEKFTSFDYESEKIGSHSVISGRVQNVFDRTPVDGANMNIGIMQTNTDENGKYLVDYIIGVDEERNKPIDIIIDAENYYPLDTTLIIFPPEMQFNLKMIYAAPIIESAWIGVIPIILPISPDPFLSPVTQVLLSDYQGIATIDSIITTFYYAKPGAPEIKTVSIMMQQDSVLSENAALYQAIGPSHIDIDYRYYNRSLEIYVSDNEGFYSHINLKNSEIFVDNPLFPVEVDP